jgi:hypothetical protein
MLWEVLRGSLRNVVRSFERIPKKCCEKFWDDPYVYKQGYVTIYLLTSLTVWEWFNFAVNLKYIEKWMLYIKASQSYLKTSDHKINKYLFIG